MTLLAYCQLHDEHFSSGDLSVMVLVDQMVRATSYSPAFLSQTLYQNTLLFGFKRRLPVPQSISPLLRAA